MKGDTVKITVENFLFKGVDFRFQFDIMGLPTLP